MIVREQHRLLLNQIFRIPKKYRFSWGSYGLDASEQGAVNVFTNASPAAVRKWFKRVGLQIRHMRYIPQAGIYRVVFVVAEMEQEATL